MKAYRKLVRQLNGAGLGYESPGRFGMNIRKGYYPVSVTEYETLREKSACLLSVLEKVNRIYSVALKKNDKETLSFFESGILKERGMRKLHRRLFREQGMRMPETFRTDTPDLKQFLEFHVGLRGLGIVCAQRAGMEEHFGCDEVFNKDRIKLFSRRFGFLSMKKGERGIYLQRTKKTGEERFFLKEAFFLGEERMEEKKDESILLFGNKDRGREVFFGVSAKDVYRRLLKRRNIFPSEWFKREDFSIKKLITGKTLIEPPPNLLYEQKMVLSAVYSPRFKGVFSDKERKIFPETYVLEKEKMMEFADGFYTLEDVINMPGNKRRFMIKYAGLDFSLNWGGRGVYRLAFKTREQSRRIVEQAVFAYERYKEPWIIQPDLSCREEAVFYDTEKDLFREKTMYRVFRPYFIRGKEAPEAEVIDIQVLSRDFYKVHCVKGAVSGLVCLKNDG